MKNPRVTFAILGAQLRLAAEKFFLERSHEADEYMRTIRDKDLLPEAVKDCIEAAGALQSSGN